MRAARGRRLRAEKLCVAEVDCVQKKTACELAQKDEPQRRRERRAEGTSFAWACAAELSHENTKATKQKRTFSGFARTRCCSACSAVSAVRPSEDTSWREARKPLLRGLPVFVAQLWNTQCPSAQARARSPHSRSPHSRSPSTHPDYADITELPHVRVALAHIRDELAHEQLDVPAQRRILADR